MLLLHTLALVHTLILQKIDIADEYVSSRTYVYQREKTVLLLKTLALEHTLFKQLNGDIFEYASLRTYSHQTD